MEKGEIRRIGVSTYQRNREESCKPQIPQILGLVRKPPICDRRLKPRLQELILARPWDLHSHFTD
jgi:hypothetical protein